MLELTEVKKDLYKSKEMAKFSHYNKGRLFYEVKILEGTYLFPIHTVEEKSKTFDLDNNHVKFINQTIEAINDCYNIDLLKNLDLSEDLGETSFFNEIKGSELIRWIGKAIKNEEIKKVG